MMNTILTAAAVLAMSTAAQAGSAVVVNQCSDALTLTAVPASGGGQSQQGPEQLQPGGSWSQPWTELSNGQGWAIKLSKGNDFTDIIQYEYTYHNDGTIWYDLSAVNGDPWNGDWSISATDGCDPRQAAYRYPTDDTYGEQSCPDGATITVVMCSSGDGGAPAGSAAPAYSAPAASTPAPAYSAPAASTPAPAYSAPAASAPAAPYPSGGADKVADSFEKLAGAHTVTHVATTVVTQWVTVSPAPMKRSNHVHRHAEHHQN